MATYIVTLHFPVAADDDDHAQAQADFAAELVAEMATGRQPGKPAVAVQVRKVRQGKGAD